MTANMETQNKLMNEAKRHVDSRLCRVSGYCYFNLLRNFFLISSTIITIFFLFWICDQSSMTEIMEIQAENPTFHVLFIPGNPGFIIMLKTRLQCMHIYTSVIHTLACNFSGVVSFYKEFLESLYEFLDGNASVIGMAALVFEFSFFESL